MNNLTEIYRKKNSDLNPNLRFLLSEWKKWRIMALQGGTRSGKTYAVIHFIIYMITEYKGITISIVRATRPSIVATVLRDFQNEMMRLGLWSDDFFNKSALEYYFNGNLVEFFSVDEEQKVRGRKRDVLFVNEVNEIERPKFLQLLLRTECFAIIDFNPSMVVSYIYDELLERDDSCVMVSTYKDNPYLSEETISEIERLKDTDPESWKIYGCGERGTNRAGMIFPSWRKTNIFPPHLPFWYGLDFGFTNDPTSIVRIAYDRNSNSIYLYEVAYQKGLMNSDIAKIIRQDVKTKESVIIDDEFITIFVKNCNVHVDFKIEYIDNKEIHNIYPLNSRVFHIDELNENVSLLKTDIQNIYKSAAESIFMQVSRGLKNISECNMEIYCDEAEPKSIRELREYGLNALRCIKGDGSIISQIFFLYNFDVMFIGDNIEHEKNNYRWKEKKGDDREFENVPVDAFNHSIDAIRYGVYTHLMRNGYNMDKIIIK